MHPAFSPKANSPLGRDRRAEQRRGESYKTVQTPAAALGSLAFPITAQSPKLVPWHSTDYIPKALKEKKKKTGILKD